MPMDTRDMPVAWDELEHGAAVNVGNPHIVFFVPEADAVALADLGPRTESDPLFPERVNVNVASLDGEHQLQLPVWGRGFGLTPACGTGASAPAVAAHPPRPARSSTKCVGEGVCVSVLIGVVA